MIDEKIETDEIIDILDSLIHHSKGEDQNTHFHLIKVRDKFIKACEQTLEQIRIAIEVINGE